MWKNKGKKHLMPAYYFISASLICCVGAVIYSNSLHCSFHFDDIPCIVDNPAIRDLHHLSAIWKFYPSRFLPFLTFALNYHCCRLNPFGYHLLNLAIHLLTAILVWRLIHLTLLTPAIQDQPISRHAKTLALLAGLIFVSHPVSVEAVTFIWQRCASLAALFYIASLYFYVKSRLSERPPRRLIYYASALITAFLGMFTKETLFTLPFIIALYDIFFFKTEPPWNIKYPAPFLLLLLIIPVSLVLSWKGLAPHFAAKISSPDYFFTEIRVMFTYLRLMFLPLHQTIAYDYPISHSFWEARTFFSFIGLVIILYAAFRLFARHRPLSLAVLWFFLTLAPESSFYPFADVIFEHRLYLPLAGYSLFLPCAAYYLLKKDIGCIVVIAVIIFNSVLTYQRNMVWSNDLTLWNDAIEKFPLKVRPYDNRGLEYMRQGNLSKALSDFNKAIDLDPFYAEGYNNRGSLYNKEGRYAQALADYTKAIQLAPDYAEAYYNRGTFYAMRQDLPHALSDFDKAISLDKAYAHAYNNRGVLYGMEGKLNQAVADFNKALEIDPGYIDAYKNRIETYGRLEKTKTP